MAGSYYRLTKNEREFIRIERIQTTVHIIHKAMEDLQRIRSSLQVWRNRIIKEGQLPPYIESYLDNFRNQCERVRGKLDYSAKLLNTCIKSPDKMYLLYRSRVDDDLKEARWMVDFYRGGLESFLYQRSDPAKQSHRFILEALILFITDLYKNLKLSGVPMPMFSHTLSIDLSQEAYRLPSEMEFKAERWCLCAHEIGHKVIQGLPWF